jgi:hypothetical protein
MKLFAYQPKGFGPASFFVMAESEDEAKASVEEFVRVQSQQDNVNDFSAEGFGTDYYKLTVLERGQVIMNDND